LKLESLCEQLELKKVQAEKLLCDTSTHADPQALKDATQEMKDADIALKNTIEEWEIAQKEYEELLVQQP
jgi:hypothetical protein